MFLMSTDKFYKEYLNSRRIKKTAIEPNYCTFNVARGAGNGHITVSNALVLATNLGKNCVLGYNSDTNELLIIPDITGNIKVTTSGRGSTKKILALQFLRAIGFTDDAIPTGRYLARLDDDGNISVMLNQKLKNSGKMRQKRV